VGEVRAQEARAAGHLGGKRGEGLLGERVAVDPHQQAGGAEAVRHEAPVAARAHGAVDGDLALVGVEGLDQLARENGDVGAWHVKQDGQEQR
jgi:hypothetical protein